MKPRVEILAPAGSYESMVAAIKAGADAIYIGGTRFGARAFADNLTEEKLLETIDYVHLHGRKIYLTINTLFKEEELKDELYPYLLPYYKQGLDAVIVQDMGVLQFIKRHFPGLPIHASTQMTITSVAGAKALEKLGVERVVTSRELQLDEIRRISEETNLEIESFVHGALCYCYSGQCLYSSLIGGRSGNRGQCAQPCRLPYKVDGQKKSNYVLSLKDICTLELIPELVDAGIYSFKIEGRMKKPEYVALVTAIYRKYVNLYLEKGRQGFCVTEKDKQDLMDLYNRGGFHEGYYHTKNGPSMVSVNRPNHAGVEVLKVIRQNGNTIQAEVLRNVKEGDVIELPSKETYTFAYAASKGKTVSLGLRKKEKVYPNQILSRTRNETLIQNINDTIILPKLQEEITGKCILSATEPSKFIVRYRDLEIQVAGNVMEKALKQPTSTERIEQQLRKTGNTEFVFSELFVQMEDDLFVPMQELNELRRNALRMLTEKILDSYRRETPKNLPYESYVLDQKKKDIVFHALAETVEQFKVICDSSFMKRIYLDCNAILRAWENKEAQNLIDMAHENGKEIYLAMPHIFRDRTRRVFEDNEEQFFAIGWDGMLIRNLETYEFLKDKNYQGKIVTDHHIYQFNQYSKKYWLDRGVEHITAPLELNYRELMEVGVENSELVVYGHLPMMVSAQCVIHTTSGCKRKKDTIFIKDRLQKAFAVKNNCDYCYNVIYNTDPIVLLDQKREIKELSPCAIRLMFTIEDAARTKEVVKMYEDVFLKDKEAMEPNFGFTRGHFKRGIK